MKYCRLMVCLLSLGIGLACQGNAAYMAEPYAGNPCCDDDETLSWTYRLEAGYAFGQFIGLEQNYEELALFVASPICNPWPFFVDVRGYHLSGDGEWAASVGTGLRVRDFCNERLWGANLYYDYREGCFGPFHRIGVGLESLGECWDLRINGYIPICSNKRNGRVYIFDDPVVDAHSTCHRQEFQFYGVDLELGAPLFCACDWPVFLYGAIGPYYYYSKDPSDVYGGYGRLELDMWEYLSLEVRVSSDNEFGTHAQGKIMITIPLDLLYSYWNGSNCCADYCEPLYVQPVRRNNVIFTEKCCDWTWNW